MTFDPLSWGLGFGSTKLATKLLENLFQKDVRHKLREAAKTWSDSLPRELAMHTDIFLGWDSPGEDRQTLQLLLVHEQTVPEEHIWIRALMEAWRARREELGSSANAFLQQDEASAAEHLGALGKALALVCKQDSSLFRVSALQKLKSLEKSSNFLVHTMSDVLEIVNQIESTRRSICRRSVARLLDFPHIPDAAGMLELNALLLVDENSSSLSGRLRRGDSWVGTEGCSRADAHYVPPGWREVGPLFNSFTEKWTGPSWSSSPFHSSHYDEIVAAIASFHHELLAIHPFEDGNGRVARVLTDCQTQLFFRQETPLNLSRCSEYFAALKAADGKNLDPLIALIESRLDISRA